MCGLVGFWNSSRSLPNPVLEQQVLEMARALRHRGPDDEGAWTDEATGIALGFRRLAIIDLSPTGHQPMSSPGGRYMAVFNGEIYNYLSLRDELELEGALPPLRGSSDTEIMLASFEHWGIESTLRRMIGMFSIALWDRHQRQLYLIRDRLGVKPLYYGKSARTLVFGSELLALQAHPDFLPEIDRDALALYLRDGHLPAPHTLLRDVYKVPPGCYLRFSSTDAQFPHPVAYWSAQEMLLNAAQNPFRGDEQAALDAVDALVHDAVRLRMVSDVPLGAFLSGGVDSSLVVAHMQRLSSQPVRTFTVGFAEAEFDEAHHARAVAHQLGTDHTEFRLSARDALDLLPTAAAHLDEPMQDSSLLPTWLVSKMARTQVTVSLSGDGGDELFGGYQRYQKVLLRHAQLKNLPPQLSAVGQTVSAELARGRKLELLKRLERHLPGPVRARQPLSRLELYLDGATRGSLENLYGFFMSHWRVPPVLFAAPPSPYASFTGLPDATQVPDELSRLMYLDLVRYLPDDVLTKVDRASMAVSLEAREPLLDHRLVALAFSLPSSLRVRGGRGKYILRRLLQRYLPVELIDRPKQGFGIPLAAWLRGPLRPWAEELLREEALYADGLLDARPIRLAWQEHLSGSWDHSHKLWGLLMFQAWRQRLRV